MNNLVCVCSNTFCFSVNGRTGSGPLSEPCTHLVLTNTGRITKAHGLVFFTRKNLKYVKLRTFISQTQRLIVELKIMNNDRNDAYWHCILAIVTSRCRRTNVTSFLSFPLTAHVELLLCEFVCHGVLRYICIHIYTCVGVNFIYYQP